MRKDLRTRLIESVERSIAWSDTPSHGKDSAHRRAVRVVDDLLERHADGQAVDRALRVIREREERSA